MKIKSEKLKEIIRYIIVGVLTTVVSLVIYYALTFTVLNPLDTLQLQLANILSWIGSIIFAYIANRKYVFHSNNTKKVKEATSFVSSRIVTLLMDMVIMYLGVTVLKMNDKWIKLISQVVVIVANYIFSKIFVFKQKKQKEKKEKQTKKSIFLIFLYSIPVAQLFQALFPNQAILPVYQILLAVFLTIGIIRNKKHLVPLSILLGLITTELLYLYCNGLDILASIPIIAQISMLPLGYFYLQDQEKLSITKKTYTKLFYLYVFLFILPMFFIDIPYPLKREIIGTMTILLPFVITNLYHHSNKVAQGLGSIILIIFALVIRSNLFTLVLFLTTLFLVIQNRNQIIKQKIKHGIMLASVITVVICQMIPYLNISDFRYLMMDNRITLASKELIKIPTANIEEQLFGIASIPELNVQSTNIDIADILLNVGYVGLGLYILVFYYILKSSWKEKKIFIFILILLILSMLSGNMLLSGSIALVIGSTQILTKDKKKILLVSNMYPSKKFKHYGSFVKNVGEDLGAFYQVDKVVMKKHNNKYIKLFAYLKFYLQAFLKSIFNTYDIIYVHFISHSAFPVIPSIITTNYTELYLNVHGNDVVADTKIDQKNIGRSKKVLKYADKVIVPSKYYKEVMEQSYKIPEDKIIVYPSGGVNTTTIIPKDKTSCKESLGLDKDITYYGMVSRIEKDKGWDTLLEALYYLKRENCLRNVKTIIIGTGAEQKEFEKLVIKYHLEQDIIQKDFVYQTELVDFYNAMDLLIFPTKRKSESLGLVGLEAMACKTFVIACDLYGPKEYMIDKENGLTYQDVKDGKELAKKIKQYQNLSSKNKEEIIGKAYQTSQKYDNTKIKKQLKNIFKEVI